MLLRNETSLPGQASAGPDRPSRRRRALLRAGAGLLVLVLGTGVVLSVTAASWGQDLRAGERLLPGVSVAEVQVGEATRSEAVAEVEAALANHLDGEVTLRHDIGTWTTTPRELGATTDLEQVIGDAFSGTVEATLPELIATRWFGSTSQLSLDVTITRDPGAEQALVAEVVRTIDLEPTDASVTWTGDTTDVTAHVEGRAVDAAALAASLSEALDTADTAAPIEVTVPTTVLPPQLTTAQAEQAAAATEQAVTAALDRPVTITFGERAWSVTPRDVGARVDGEAVVLASLAAPATTPGVPLTIEPEDLTATVATIAAEVDIAPVAATASYRGGRVEITPEREGRAVDRAGARSALAAALVAGDGELTLPVGPARAAITRASFDTVLVVRQSDRVLELHRGGQLAQSWPVAVGTGGSPTPTGTFVVGAKRFEPTWVNPAPDRWGADLPARIGPGPNNPLGLRALNWNRPGGGDTLIRFHGTPNEDSIGEAASNGCVRMFNRDVVELYDLVPSGAMILSIG
jgi:lipoprotein-anchoring transpeptidase ErfK/SrfK